MTYLPTPGRDRFSDTAADLLSDLTDSRHARDKQDALQESFIKFIERYGKDELERFPEKNLSHCLKRMTYREQINQARHTKRRREQTGYEADHLSHLAEATEPADFARRELALRYYKQLSKIDPLLAEAAVLRYDGHSYQQIHDMLGLPYCAKSLANKLKRFRDIVIKNDGNPLER